MDVIHKLMRKLPLPLLQAEPELVPALLEFKYKQARRMVALRWVAFASLLGLHFLVITYAQPTVLARFILITLLAAIAINVLFHALYHFIGREPAHPKSPERRLYWLNLLIFANVCFDLMFLGVGFLLTGGTEGPVFILYPIYLGAIATALSLLPLVLATGLAIVSSVVITEFIRAHPAFLQHLALRFDTFTLLIPQQSHLQEALYGALLILSAYIAYSLTRHMLSLHLETTRQRHHLEKLHRLVRLALQNREPDSIYQALADHLVDIFDADGAFLTLWDEEQQRVLPMAAYGPLREQYRSLHPPRHAKTLTAHLRDHVDPLGVADVFDTPYLDPELAALFPSRSLLAMPLRSAYDNRYLGAALVAYNSTHHFSPEEIRHAKQVADTISLLLSEAHHHHQAEKRAHLLQTLHSTATGIIASLDRENIIGQAVEKLQLLLDAPRSAAFVFDPATGRLTCPVALGLSSEYVEAILARYTVVPGSQVLFGESHVMIPDVATDERTQDIRPFLTKEGIRAYLVLPISSPQGPLGALVAYWNTPRSLGENELAVAQLFADRVGNALHNAHLHAVVTELANSDELTNLPNRRAIDRRLETEIKRARRYQRIFAVLMLDLDGFKDINDSYGHAFGDHVLGRLATCMLGALRETDFLGRYGGDEFVAILPETDLINAEKVAHKLRAAIRLCTPELVLKPLSLSVGIALYPQDADDAAALLQAADTALYHAKDSGKDCVRIYSAL